MQLMVEGLLVLPLSSSDSRRSLLYFSINSDEICANVLPLRLLLSQIIGNLYLSLFSKEGCDEGPTRNPTARRCRPCIKGS